jgi:YgiT-type zinc finger domain-containing protein
VKVVFYQALLGMYRYTLYADGGAYVSLSSQYIFLVHQNSLARKIGGKNMENKKCNFCGSERFEERRIEYLYAHQGKYLLVPNTPVEICLNCGMIYYNAAVLKEIERRFFAIQDKTEEPDRYISVPEKDFA